MEKRSKQCLLGVDIGSNGCKTVIVDLEGEVLASASREYITYYPKPGYAEQDPNDWFRAFVSTLKEVSKQAGIKASDILSVSIDGMGASSTFLDEEGRILRPTIHWTDQRSVEEVEWLRKEFGYNVNNITYQPIGTTFILPQLLWVKKEQPDVLNKTYKVLMPKDYIRHHMTGDWCTDPSDASHTLIFDMERGRWSGEICEFTGIPIEKLPEIVPSFKAVGSVTRSASKETGLSEGTPVATGALDASAELLGAGVIYPRQSLIRLGTAGAIFSVMDTPYNDLERRALCLCHSSPNLWYVAMVTQSCGSSLRWFRDTFCREEVTMAKRMKSNPYSIMDEEAAKISAGSEGLIFHPYLLGERAPYWDPHLAGDFFGITFRHGKGHFIRSILEGIAFSFRDCFRILQEMRITLEEAKAIGGGAKSRLWRQIISDVLGVRLVKPVIEDASFGSALIGGIAIGVFKSADDAVKKCVRIMALNIPEAEKHRLYEDLFLIYKGVHDKVADLYKCKPIT